MISVVLHDILWTWIDFVKDEAKVELLRDLV